MVGFGLPLNNKRIATNLLPALLAILLRRSPGYGARLTIHIPPYFTTICLHVNYILLTFSKWLKFVTLSPNLSLNLKLPTENHPKIPPVKM